MLDNSEKSDYTYLGDRRNIPAPLSPIIDKEGYSNENYCHRGL